MQNSGIFLDINALRSVENIKKTIAKYKEQQEYLLLKIAPPSAPSASHASTAGGELDTKVFDHLCILASVRKNRYKLGIHSSSQQSLALKSHHRILGTCSRRIFCD